MGACTCSAVVLGVGATLAALAAVGSVYWPVLYFNRLTEMLVLTNVSMSYSMWQETPIPMYLELFLWNMTNSADVLAAPADAPIKPHFQQLGPYVYRETHLKTNLTWHPDNSTVTFHNNRTWQYEPDMSNGSLHDQVTNINVVVATAVNAMRLRSALLRPLVNAALQLFHEHALLTASVSEWIFDGIEDPVIHWAIDNNIPIGIPFDRFGWFYTRNGSETYDGVFNMETGAADVSRLGNVAQWNHVSRTSYFRDHCADIKGSTGELWPPELDEEERTIFASDLCTYMTMHREQEISHLGIPGVRYIANDSVFDNGHHYPAMSCYCERPDTVDCVPSGVLNVSSCRLGAPAFVSFPHFYNADPIYVDKVGGMQPNKEEHEFYMGLEVLTGIPLEVRAQLQVNVLLRRVAGMSIGDVLPDDTMVPMFWFRQEVRLTDEYAAQARTALLVRDAVLYAFYALVGLGLCVVAGATFVLVRRLLASDQPRLLSADDPAHTAAAPAASLQ